MAAANEQEMFLLRHIRSTLIDLSRRLQQDTVSEDVADYVFFRLQQIQRHLARMAHRIDAIDDVQTSLSYVTQILSEVETRSLDHYHEVLVSESGMVGRPKFVIPREQLEYLINFDIGIPDIAGALGVSVSTIKRRIREFGISVTERRTIISDDDLDGIVRDIQRDFPNAGYRRMQSQLVIRDIKVSQARVREAMQRVDPEGVATRWLSITPRAVYCVSGPLALWHIDGNHKLIRWRIVIHGGVDGFTRIPVFLKASNNNRAQTVLGLFLQAIDEYGLPSRVRSDKGGENVDVSKFMLEHPQRGPGRGSMIVGRSVHNQRIERLWRDIYEGVTFIYYHLFYHMEEVGALDPANPLHLFALHYVYLPRINHHLQIWKNGYIHHRIRTAGNHSPMQLYVLGLLRLRGTESTVAQEMYEPHTEGDIQSYGIDWDGPLPELSEDASLVEVPDTPNPLTPVQMQDLCDNIEPLQQSNSYGIDIFLDVLSFITS